MHQSENGGPIRYHPQNLEQLAAMELYELEWIVQDLVPRGCLLLFAGREKSGKSLIAADLAACVASAEPFLDREVQPGPVILVPAEENLRDVRDRLHTRLGGNTGPPLYVLPVNRGEDDLLDLANPACLKAMREVITQVEPALLVLDPFRELHRLSENDSDQMGPLLKPLRQLAHDTDSAIILIHHMNRGGSFRGSTAIRASADLEWAFRRPEEVDVTSTELAGTLSVEGRFGPRQHLRIRLGDGFRWQLSIQALSSSPSARGHLVAHLAAVLEPVTAHEIAASLGVAVKTIQNAMAEERHAGMTAITVSGSGRKGDPFRYIVKAAS